MENKDRKDIRSMVSIMLGAVSLILFAGSIYFVKEFSILWGSGAGSVLQASADNAVTIAVLQPITSNLGLFHIAILISYLLFIISLMLTCAALIMFMHRKESNTAQIKTYGLLHTALVLFYALIILILMSYFLQYIQSYYVYVIYAGIALGVVAGAYIQYDVRIESLPSRRGAGTKNAINMDPSKPFSNMLNLQEELFSKMSGKMYVVDKHFNSSALANFHRLADPYISNFTNITILTSQEMLDTSFSTSVMDFNKELSSSGTNVEVRIMDPKDSAEQHERFVMDERTAYKIPPFNIINKKSEHITKIKLSEAKSRFYYLYGRASKIDNYLVRKGHEEQNIGSSV